ncbi:hypothetical protein PAPYR_13157 [Paratrimastix pyriformis]|uniref:Uncharacterized protein n=1 Tax=Paratrimastix pyriformis TaxID=342808 RepID=A0ABQ8U4C4_9EUKA|nr:hypothetical protein PAPYR_13157 [Paratrimastix pyriformis]
MHLPHGALTARRQGGILPTSTPAPSAPSYSGPTGYQSDPVLAMLCGYQSDPAILQVTPAAPAPEASGAAVAASVAGLRVPPPLPLRPRLHPPGPVALGSEMLERLSARLGDLVVAEAARPRALSCPLDEGQQGFRRAAGRALVAGAADDGAGYSGTLLHRDLAGSPGLSVGVVGLGAPQPGPLSITGGLTTHRIRTEAPGIPNSGAAAGVCGWYPWVVETMRKI